MKKIVIFGAGNIGRSFIGQLFSRSGYKVVFIDIDDKIVNALNKRRRYRIEIKDVQSETIWVENIRAVDAKDEDKVADEIATADVVATAVGPNNLPSIYGNIARGLIKRRRLNRGSLDIVICENVRNASNIFRKGLSKHLTRDYPLDSVVGLVETSTGKMVPIMTKEQRRKDPLLVFAEAYNTLIVDKNGFKGEIPKVKGLEARENMAAYVDRKIFVHNMGHAVTAYLGYIADPDIECIWEAISEKNIRRAVEWAMWESGRALIAEHRTEFSRENMREHIDDLIRRFGNRALGDTIYRVGRDVHRKLSRSDRLIGALLLDAKHDVSAPWTTLGAASAMLFRGKDEKGEMFKEDRIFAEEIYPRGVDFVLREVCGLDFRREKDLVDNIREAYEFIIRDPKNWFSWPNLKVSKDA